jgi:3-methyladenine DNA glycosylase AlkC
MFKAAVTKAVAHIVNQTSEEPPKFLVKLLVSFRGASAVEVSADRITATNDR